jgi:hypothetical protein
MEWLLTATSVRRLTTIRRLTPTGRLPSVVTLTPVRRLTSRSASERPGTPAPSHWRSTASHCKIIVEIQLTGGAHRIVAQRLYRLNRCRAHYSACRLGLFALRLGSSSCTLLLLLLILLSFLLLLLLLLVTTSHGQERLCFLLRQLLFFCHNIN